jgi:hypothetical protein
MGWRLPIRDNRLLIQLPKLRGSDSYPRGTVFHRTCQPSLGAQRPPSSKIKYQLFHKTYSFGIYIRTVRAERD